MRLDFLLFVFNMCFDYKEYNILGCDFDLFNLKEGEMYEFYYSINVFS